MTDFIDTLSPLTIPWSFVDDILFCSLLRQSTVMKAIAARAIPIPENLDIYFLNSEYPARDDITALEAVMESNDEVQQLEAKAEALNDAMADADEDGQAEIQQSLVSAKYVLQIMGVFF